MAAVDVKQLKERFEAVGQGHVFTFYDELSEDEKARLTQQLGGMDPKRISVSFAFGSQYLPLTPP